MTTLFSALDLSAYLKALGWTQVQAAVKDRLYVFSHPDFAPQQLVFAMSDELTDYDETLERAAHRLAEIYQLGLTEAVLKVQEYTDDIIVSRVEDSNSTRRRTTVPLLYALQALEAQKEMLSAGAAANEARRAFYSGTYKTTRQLLDEARFRHTEQGSFIFKTSCGVHAMEAPPPKVPLFPEDDLPPIDSTFVRRAMININTGVHDVARAIATDTEEALIQGIKEQTSPSPVSANLCHALAELRDEERPREVGIWISWSPLLTLPADTPKTPVILKPADFPRIEEIERELKPHKPINRGTFIGTVEELYGTFNKRGQREGKVVLSIIDEQKLVRVKVTLEPQQYDAAVAVHRTMQVMASITGTIERKTRQPYGFDLELFKIINAPSPSD